MKTYLLTSDQQDQLDACMKLALKSDQDMEHLEQVKKLSLMLFDKLFILHKLDAESRFDLLCAAVMHDLGLVEGDDEHHKTTLRMIITSPELKFTDEQRLIIGSIARYHRKNLPDALKHEHFASLSTQEQRRVSLLASFLRIADGLDAGHHGSIKSFRVQIRRYAVMLRLEYDGSINNELNAACSKRDLFEQVFNRPVYFQRSDDEADFV